jgi:hypothetical protein
MSLKSICFLRSIFDSNDLSVILDTDEESSALRIKEGAHYPPDSIRVNSRGLELYLLRFAGIYHLL